MSLIKINIQKQLNPVHPLIQCIETAPYIFNKNAEKLLDESKIDIDTEIYRLLNHTGWNSGNSYQNKNRLIKMLWEIRVRTTGWPEEEDILISERSIFFLMDRLKDRNRQIKTDSLETLHLILGDIHLFLKNSILTQCKEELISLLEDNNKQIKIFAFSALVDILDEQKDSDIFATLPENLSTLIQKSLTDRNDKIKKCAVSTMEKIYRKGGRFLRLIKQDQEKIIHSLVIQLQDPHPLIQFHSAKAICAFLEYADRTKKDTNCMCRQITGKLIQAFPDAAYDIKPVLIDAMRKTGNKDTVTFLISQLKNNDAVIKNKAAIVLGDIGDKAATGPLMQLLFRQDCSFKPDVLDALAQIGDKKAASLITDLLFGKWLNSENPELICSAIHALAEIKSEEAIDPLINLLSFAEKHIVLSAVEALGRFRNKKAIKPLMKLLDDSDPELSNEIALSLGMIGAKEALTPLIHIVEKGFCCDPAVWLDAVSCLGDIGGAKAIDSLNRYRDDEEDLAIEAVMRALGDGLNELDRFYKE